jgi:peptide/nickel transport system substrate-binding protein
MKTLSRLFLLLIFVAVSSCQKSIDLPVDSSPSTALEDPESRTLTICLGYEPESLYPYRANSQAAREVLQAIYDGPINIYYDGRVEPVILKNMPTFEDNSAFFTPVTVSEGDEVVNTYGDLVSLQSGTRVFPSGCTSPSCALAWDGSSELQLDQLTVSYEFIEGVLWSDGWPLTAADSVYAFQVASDPATPVSKQTIDQTASYTIMDDGTLEWVGKPGLVTDAFEDYFWTPMPEHAWGKYSAEELLDAEEVNRTPLGWGAYVLEEWQPGEFIRLRKNPIYFRANEGLPAFDQLTFKVTNRNGDTNLSNLKFDREQFEIFNLDVGEFDQEVSQNGCDLISTTVDMQDQFAPINILLNYYQDPWISLHKSPRGDQEIMLLNYREDIDSLSPELGKDKNPLSSVAVREAIGYCLDRDLVNRVVFKKQLDPATFWPETYTDENVQEFNPEKGIKILEKAGWVDHDDNQNTGRISNNADPFPDGISLTFSYMIGNTRLDQTSANIYKASLAECGIDVIVRPAAPEDFWNPASEKSIFKGRFELAQIEWATPIQNPCPLATSTNIPSEENGFVGLNFSAYHNELVDKKCAELSETKMYAEKEKILAIIIDTISEDLLLIPLNNHREAIVSRNDLCKISNNTKNGLSAIEEFNYGKSCTN